MPSAPAETNPFFMIRSKHMARTATDFGAILVLVARSSTTVPPLRFGRRRRHLLTFASALPLRYVVGAKESSV